MKTLRALRRLNLWGCIFCFFCVLSMGCLAIFSVSGSGAMFGIGSLAVYGWMVNPFPILSCVRCLKAYLKDRKDPEEKRLIGRKWIRILLWPAITTVFWLLCGILFVAFTGGV